MHKLFTQIAEAHCVVERHGLSGLPRTQKPFTQILEAHSNGDLHRSQSSLLVGSLGSGTGNKFGNPGIPTESRASTFSTTDASTLYVKACKRNASKQMR